MLKANNTCACKYLDNQIWNVFLLLIKSRALVWRREIVKCVIASWHRTTWHLTQTETWQVAQERRKGKREDTPSLLPEGEAKEKERRRVFTGAERRRAFKETCWGTTRIDIILYDLSGDSLQAEEKDRIEIDQAREERNTMLSGVSMLAARRNFTGSPRQSHHM